MASPSVDTLRVLPRSRAPRSEVGVLTPAQARERWLNRRIGLIWALLVLNVLTFAPGVSLIPIPYTVGKMITQGSVSIALLIALTVNRKFTFRPSVFLFLVTLLALEAILPCFFAFSKGLSYRTFRYAEFVAVMWLLTPYWARRDMLLTRCYMKTLGVVLVSVLLGFAIAPGHVLRNRFEGTIWPVEGIQVAHYSAVFLGMVIIFWMSGRLHGRITLLIAVTSAAMLILTHTRTALTGAIAGILVAGLSLISGSPRVRKFLGGIVGVVAVALVTSSAAITSWLARGEGTTQLYDLSGRTTVWGPLLAFPRNMLQEVFGFGLSNGFFNGHAVDSNWLSAYQEQGLFGVVVCVLILIFLYIAAAFQTDRLRRALALFLITYCLVASFTEDGFTSPTTYTLDLMIAASLLVPFELNRNPS
jgi:hypothetical protein